MTLDIRPTVPVSGQVHLSLPRKEGEAFGAITSFFAVYEDGYTSKEAVDAFRAAYGDSPSRLRVMFLSADPAKSGVARMLMYDPASNKTLCSGDGDIGHPAEGGIRNCASRGCPFAKSATGHLATEDLCWALAGLGVDTGVDLSALVATSVWMAKQLGRPSPSRVVQAMAGTAAQGSVP